MASVAHNKLHGKIDVTRLLDEQMIERICQEQNHHWRDLKLPPVATLQHFAWQIAMGNATCDQVKHHVNGRFTASAYCQARARVPLGVFQALARHSAEAALKQMGQGQDPCWRGHRVFRIDGTSMMLPDTPEVRRYFGCSGKQKPGCGYPTAHLLLLTGPGGVGVDVICSPLRTGDMTHAARTHARLQQGDLLLGDRLFGGWGHLQQLLAQGLHGLFPVHHSRKIGWGRNADHGPSRRFVRTLGWRDQLVEYRKPAECPKWMDRKTYQAAPQWILVREVQRSVMIGGVRRKVTLVTTLLDAVKYPPQALVQLLGERWLIETQIRSLKTTMGLEQLRCQSVEGVKKELLMYLIVYNQLRLLMLQAAVGQGVHVSRISFADALARLRYGDPQVWAALELIPLRPGRMEPRVVKRRSKPFPRMTQPRALLRRKLKHPPQRAAA